LVSRDFAYQFASRNPEPIKFLDEINYFGRRIGVRVRTIERIFFRSVETRNKPISHFESRGITESNIDDAVGNVVSFRSEIPALRSNEILKPPFQSGVWVPVKVSLRLALISDITAAFPASMQTTEGLGRDSALDICPACAPASVSDRRMGIATPGFGGNLQARMGMVTKRRASKLIVILISLRFKQGESVINLHAAQGISRCTGWTGAQTKYKRGHPWK
jgi:hypothetical protein